jgi:hypothetical protein
MTEMAMDLPVHPQPFFCCFLWFAFSHSIEPFILATYSRTSGEVLAEHCIMPRLFLAKIVSQKYLEARAG